jgi:hypothetical protein
MTHPVRRVGLQDRQNGFDGVHCFYCRQPLVVAHKERVVRCTRCAVVHADVSDVGLVWRPIDEETR